MGRPTSALIVDDEPHVRIFVRLLLQQLGVTKIWEAADGDTAILLAQQHGPEVALLDVNLPRRSGVEVLRALGEVLPDLPVIMLSSQDAMKTVLECRALGAVTYILKHSPKSEALRMLRDAFNAIEQASAAADE